MPPRSHQNAAVAFDNTLSNLALSGSGSKLRSPAPGVVSTSGGPPSMHPLPTSVLCLRPKIWLQGSWGEFPNLQSTCQSPSLPLPLRLGDLSGRVWMRLTSPYASVCSLTALTRPLSIISWLLRPMSATEP